jgi:hypothetical protein
MEAGSIGVFHKKRQLSLLPFFAMPCLSFDTGIAASAQGILLLERFSDAEAKIAAAAGIRCIHVSSIRGTQSLFTAFE